MKKEAFMISVPKPCNENWHKMTPVEKGRFCASCQKTVTDFTILTDEEIILMLAASSGNTQCGRFSMEQLNKAMNTGKAMAA